MKQALVYSAIFFAMLLHPGCDRSKQVNPAPVIKVTTTGMFIPPADSSLTAEQIAAWQACNTLLDSLSFVYKDSFSTDDPQLRLRYRHDFNAAQERICIHQGLGGGYNEYRWIIQALANPRNDSLCRAFGLAVY